MRPKINSTDIGPEMTEMTESVVKNIKVVMVTAFHVSE